LAKTYDLVNLLCLCITIVAYLRHYSDRFLSILGELRKIEANGWYCENVGKIHFKDLLTSSLQEIFN